jgi:site-specific recombinase XerD
MVLSFAQLESSLLDVVNYPTGYSPYINDFFSNLYSIGCRPTELLSSSHWMPAVGPDWILTPSKNNNNRYISASQMSSYFIGQLISGNPKPYPCSYGKFLYYFEQWYQYQPCSIGARSVDLYLFRHHFVKKLFNDGMSVPAITAYMGWINPLMADNYINSVIVTP